MCLDNFHIHLNLENYNSFSRSQRPSEYIFWDVPKLLPVSLQGSRYKLHLYLCIFQHKMTVQRAHCIFREKKKISVPVSLWLFNSQQMAGVLLGDANISFRARGEHWEKQTWDPESTLNIHVSPGHFHSSYFLDCTSDTIINFLFSSHHVRLFTCLHLL